MSANEMPKTKKGKARVLSVSRYVTVVASALILVVLASYLAFVSILNSRQAIGNERSELLVSYQAKSDVSGAIFDYLGGKSNDVTPISRATLNLSESLSLQIENRPSFAKDYPLFVSASAEFLKISSDLLAVEPGAQTRAIVDRLIDLTYEVNIEAGEINKSLDKELDQLSLQFYFVLVLAGIAFIFLSYFLMLMRTTLSKISRFTSEIMRRLGEGVDYNLPSEQTLTTTKLLPGADLIVGETVKLAQMYQEALVKERRLFVEQRELTVKFEETNMELVAAKEETFRAAQLSAIGKVAGSVSHEINNPITGILGYIAYVRKKSTDADLIMYLGKAQKEVERIGRIAKSLLVFSRHNAVLPSAKFDLYSSVDNVVVLAGPQLHDALVEIDVAPISDLPSVIGRIDEFQQCLLNLILNARDALKTSTDKKIWITARINGDKLQLLVTDSGKGVPEEFRQFLFQPFHTTKPGGEGSGLGLSVCRELMNRMGGSAEFDPSYGPGARFILTLPIFAEPAAPTVVA